MKQLELGGYLKERGQDLVESNNETWIEHIRGYAVRYSLKHGNVTIDDVWKHIGRFKSKRPSNHAHVNNVWEYIR